MYSVTKYYCNICHDEYYNAADCYLHEKECIQDAKTKHEKSKSCDHEKYEYDVDYDYLERYCINCRFHQYINFEYAMDNISIKKEYDAIFPKSMYDYDSEWDNVECFQAILKNIWEFLASRVEIESEYPCEDKKQYFS